VAMGGFGGLAHPQGRNDAGGTSRAATRSVENNDANPQPQTLLLPRAVRVGAWEVLCRFAAEERPQPPRAV
jgi:hypothetical protein